MPAAARRKRESLRKELRALIAPPVVRLLCRLAARMSVPQAQRFGARLGRLGRFLARHRVRITLRNLQLAFRDELSEAERKRLLLASFEAVGMMGMEMLKLPGLSAEELAALAPFEGLEHLDASVQTGRGTLLVSAHLGNWEIGAVRLIQAGYRVVALSRPSSMQRIVQAIDSIRGGLEFETIPVRDGIRPCLRLLQDNGILAIMPDRYARGQGLDVKFFGHTTNAWHTPVLLALRTGAQILPCHALRRPDGTFRFLIEEPVNVHQTVEETSAMQLATQEMFDRLEALVRQYPEQYLWQYDFWPMPGRERPTPHSQR